MSALPETQLELSDIQATVLRPRPAPYRGQYVILRIGDAAQGRELVRRLIPHVAPAEEWWHPILNGWLGVVFTYSGFKALGLPQDTLDSFPEPFRQGMAARAGILNDTGWNAPEHWQAPFGSPDVHIALALYAKDQEHLDEFIHIAREAHQDLPKLEILYRLNFSELPEGRNPFGFRDGLHNPRVGSSGAPLPNTQPSASGSDRPLEVDAPVKPGEFVLGYEDELGQIAQSPRPEQLRLNGTFVAFRKFRADVAAFRRFLRDNSNSPEEEELLAAKMVGRWRSGAPLVLAPEKDDPSLGADLARNNQFSYSEDLRGMRCPFGAHIRRVNPRDSLSDSIVNVNIHKFIRRGTNYGPPLPDGVLDDDGVERGGIFLIVGAYLDRQFEFVQSQWIADGDFMGEGAEQDPLLGNAEGDRFYTIPKQPIRRRLKGLPHFLRMQGGEYCFMPGIRGLKWIAGFREQQP
jgi:Dyp-type peroxidase family